MAAASAENTIGKTVCCPSTSLCILQHHHHHHPPPPVNFDSLVAPIDRKSIYYLELGILGVSVLEIVSRELAKCKFCKICSFDSKQLHKDLPG
jgi:hypothetical protein